MAGTPMAEQIEAAVETLLKTISVANGYNYDYKNNGADSEMRRFRHINEFNQFPDLLCPPSTELPLADQTAGTVAVSQYERQIALPVYGYVKTDEQGTDLNKVRQDVERALFSVGPPILNVTGVTHLSPPTVEKANDPADDRRSAILMVFTATYRYARGNP